MSDTVVTRVENLSVHYALKGSFLRLGKVKTVKAVQDVSFSLRQGEILGLVGESGCGKSSLGKALVRLVDASSGKIEIGGLDFLNLSGAKLRHHRSVVQMIFQDPYASLDPRMSVYDILAEPLRAHRFGNESRMRAKIERVMDLVALPRDQAKRYPHEFSGGQRQRVAIARALILEPKLIVADEPVSSLDVSVQAQILNLLKDIQKQLNLSMIFISHNLAVVKYLADRIAVMYLGKIVEIGERETLFANPQHPYTKALLSAVPIPDPKKERARIPTILHGEIPSPITPPPGCAFHTRCPIAMPQCKQNTPTLVKTATTTVSCFAIS